MDYEAVAPSVKVAARKAASKFPDHHDAEDVEQTLWVWVMENKNTVSRVIDEADYPGAVLEPLLVKAAMTFLKKEDAATYGYDEEDAFNFSIELIKSILEVVFTHEDWQSMAQAIGDGMPRQKSDPATSGNNLASYADVSRAVAMLPDEQYNLLVWRYKYNRTFQQIGEEAGVSRHAARERLEGAVSAIQQLLGKRDLSDFRRGFSGRTEARGNAASQAQVERDYEG